MSRKCIIDSNKRRLNMNTSIRADILNALTMYSNVQSLPRSMVVEQAIYEYLVARKVIERDDSYAERY